MNKRIAILVTVLVVSAVFWAVASGWLNSPTRFDSWGGILLSGALLTVMGSALALAFLLLSRSYWTTYVIAGVLVIFLLVFGFGPLLLVGAALAWMFWWTAARRIARELTERRTIRVSSILSHGLPYILLGLYIMVSFAFYLAPGTHMTAKEATTSFQKQLNKSSGAVLQSELDKLPPSQREQVKLQVNTQAAKTFAGMLNYRFCLPGSGTCTPTLLELLPPLYAFLFFLTLYGFGFIFRELGMLLGAGVFTILQGSHFLTVDQEDAKVDMLKL